MLRTPDGYDHGMIILVILGFLAVIAVMVVLFAVISRSKDEKI